MSAKNDLTKYKQKGQTDKHFIIPNLYFETWIEIFGIKMNPGIYTGVSGPVHKRALALKFFSAVIPKESLVFLILTQLLMMKLLVFDI